MATKQELQDQVEQQHSRIAVLEGELEEAYALIRDDIRILENVKEGLILIGESTELHARQSEITNELNALAFDMVMPDSHQEHDHASNAWVDEGTP